jgi:hypothetical protein
MRNTFGLALLFLATAYAANVVAQSTDAPNPLPTESDELSLDQSHIADRFADVEQLILRMAELDQTGNPRRADLLKKAFSLGKERDILLQLESASRLLNQDKYKRAIDGQLQARADLKAMLELLLSENRSDRLKDEQARVREYIREIERLERMQRSVQARTEGGVDNQQTQSEQERVADRTRMLERQIDENERSANELEDGAGDEANGESDGTTERPSEGESDDGGRSGSRNEPSAGEKDAGEEDADANDTDDRDQESKRPKLGENPLRQEQPAADSSSEPSPDGTQGESQDVDSSESPSAPQGQSQQGQSQQGQSQQGQSQQGQSQQGQSEDDTERSQPPEEPQDFPGRKRVVEAERHMREAEQKLAEAERDGAIEQQKKAAQKLAEAKAELEEILHQMREEEIERVLAALEARFRKMLEMQLRVYETTMRVDKISENHRNRIIDIEAGKLSSQEKRIVVEADRCLNLLREEGSSVAFPESVQQMREDMQFVADRLAKSDVGRLTQGIEEDIIEALEEMLEALEKAQADQEERKQQQSPPSTGGTPGDLPLVDAIAELKMLKALQLRINRRTTRYATLLDNADDPVGRPSDEQLLLSIQNLSDRQGRLHQITRDISLGKNK